MPLITPLTEPIEGLDGNQTIFGACLTMASSPAILCPDLLPFADFYAAEAVDAAMNALWRLGGDWYLDLDPKPGNWEDSPFFVSLDFYVKLDDSPWDRILPPAGVPQDLLDAARAARRIAEDAIAASLKKSRQNFKLTRPK